MDSIAKTPEPPYFAVIFTSLRTSVDEGYASMAGRMLELAADQPGFLGAESAREGLGITVSYWQDLESIRNWKNHAEHKVARELGRGKWYAEYSTRICRVEREYSFSAG